MTLNAMLPVTGATPSVSPVPASPPGGSNANAGANAQGNAAVNGKSSKAANDTSSTVNGKAAPAESASATADAAANAQADADLFARLLGAQMDQLATPPATTETPVAATTDKAEKPATPASVAADPALLLNPALAALQQPVAPIVARPQPTTPVAANDEAPADVALGEGKALPSAVGALPQARTDAKLAAEGDKDTFASLTQSAAGKHQDAALVQNLPQDNAAQATILPQGTQPSKVDMAQKNAPLAPNYTIDQHVGTPAWSRAIGEHVMAMVNIKAETAHIQVSPPQLGPIEVTLKMDAQNNAQVTFAADSPATRAALENSLPKLHTLMAAGGIQLGDAQVSSGHSQRQQQQASQSQGRFNDLADSHESEEMDTLASIKAARGVLSIFA